uniref:Uncharacterized protein n=1 Tax=Arundo donax TaxID=35708 RepID=A0A0A8XS44_ARUDO
MLLKLILTDLKIATIITLIKIN